VSWISIHRKIFDNEFYFLERFTKMQAWIDLLLLANHKRAVVFVRGLEIRLKPGELFHSQDTLAKRWGWNKRTVKGFLTLLSNRQMIHYRIENKIGVITIVNWKKYQKKDKKMHHKMHYRVHPNNNDIIIKPENKSNRMSKLQWLS